MATDYAIGDLVWYAPTPGARFAGIVVGEGTLRGTMAVRLHASYWQCKGRANDSGIAVAVADQRLTPRDVRIYGFDEL